MSSNFRSSGRAASAVGLLGSDTNFAAVRRTGPQGKPRAWRIWALTPITPYKIRLNQASDNPAESNANAAASSARRPDISVSFFSTASRELRVS